MQPATLAANVKTVFTCLLDQVRSLPPITSQILYFLFRSTYIVLAIQVSQYLTEGLDRARDSLTEAAALREKFVLGTNISRRVAAAAASAVII